MKKLFLLPIIVAVTIFSYVSNLIAQDDYDTTPPGVGNILFDCCKGLIIPITDNVAVDLKGTSVEIINNLTKQPVPLPPPVYEGDGTPFGTITYKFDYQVLTTDKYELNIVARDASHNVTAIERSIVVVPSCPPPACVSISPNSVVVGEAVAVTIKGVNACFNETTVVAFANPGISMVIDTVSENEIKGTLTIAEDALCGSFTVTVKTGDEILRCPDFVSICCCLCSCSGISPSSITPSETGASGTVTITLEGNCDNIKCDDSNFPPPGITVNSVSADGLTCVFNITATAACGSPASTGAVGIKVGDNLFSSCGSFTINAAPECCEILSVNRSRNSFFGLRSWLLFPHPVKINITGSENCSWSNNCDVIIEGLECKVISAMSNSIEAQCIIPPRISGFKPGEKPVAVCGVEGANLTIK